MTPQQQDQLVAEFMRARKYEPWVYEGSKVTLWKPSNGADLPDFTAEQATFMWRTAVEERRNESIYTFEHTPKFYTLQEKDHWFKERLAAQQRKGEAK